MSQHSAQQHSPPLQRSGRGHGLVLEGIPILESPDLSSDEDEEEVSSKRFRSKGVGSLFATNDGSLFPMPTMQRGQSQPRVTWGETGEMKLRGRAVVHCGEDENNNGIWMMRDFDDGYSGGECQLERESSLFNERPLAQASVPWSELRALRKAEALSTSDARVKESVDNSAESVSEYEDVESDSTDSSERERMLQQQFATFVNRSSRTSRNAVFTVLRDASSLGAEGSPLNRAPVAGGNGDDVVQYASMPRWTFIIGSVPRGNVRAQLARQRSSDYDNFTSGNCPSFMAPSNTNKQKESTLVRAPQPYSGTWSDYFLWSQWSASGISSQRDQEDQKQPTQKPLSPLQRLHVDENSFGVELVHLNKKKETRAGMPSGKAGQRQAPNVIMTAEEEHYPPKNKPQKETKKSARLQRH